MNSPLLPLALIFVAALGAGSYLFTHGERDVGGMLMGGAFLVLFLVETKTEGKS